MKINEVIGGLGAIYQHMQEILSMLGHPVADQYKQPTVRSVLSIITDLTNTKVSLIFKSPYGPKIRAVLQLNSLDSDEFKRKIISASYTVKKPTMQKRTFESADRIIENGVGRRGIAILTNPAFWKLVGFKIENSLSYPS